MEKLYTQLYMLDCTKHHKQHVHVYHFILETSWNPKTKRFYKVHLKNYTARVCQRQILPCLHACFFDIHMDFPKCQVNHLCTTLHYGSIFFDSTGSTSCFLSFTSVSWRLCNPQRNIHVCFQVFISLMSQGGGMS